MGWYRALGPTIKAAVERLPREQPNTFKKMMYRTKV